MTVSIADIKAKYPNPKRVTDDMRDGEGYCVGGALCLYQGIDRRFPGLSTLALAIEQANPDADDVYRIAQAILQTNDYGDFELAWALLDKVLTDVPKRDESNLIKEGKL